MRDNLSRSLRRDLIEGYNGPSTGNQQVPVSQLEHSAEPPQSERGWNGAPSGADTRPAVPPPPPPKK